MTTATVDNHELGGQHVSEHIEELRIQDLHAFYGESHALHGIDMTVHQGELVTLLGRNGSGRTTTLRALLGLVDRRSGSMGTPPQSSMIPSDEWPIRERSTIRSSDRRLRRPSVC